MANSSLNCLTVFSASTDYLIRGKIAKTFAKRFFWTRVIRQITQPIGTLEIVEADGQSSVGRIITGNGFKIGDLAKPIR